MIGVQSSKYGGVVRRRIEGRVKYGFEGNHLLN
jgi:hypothetical protein